MAAPEVSPLPASDSLARRPALLGLVLAVTALLLGGWLSSTPEGLLGKADAVGYAVCHRIDVRSFHLGGRPISLCARCTGMYLGAVLAVAFLAGVNGRRGGNPSRGVLVALAVLFAAFGVDGVNSFGSLLPGLPTLYTPNNTLRLFTGTGMGVIMGVGVTLVFNQTMWRGWDARPVLAGLRQLAALLAVGLAGALLVRTENPLILYPLALVSAAGVLMLLTMVYASLWLIVLRQENRFTHPLELALPLVGGFAMGLLQIVALDALRFWLTGTWDGFHVSSQ